MPMMGNFSCIATPSDSHCLDGGNAVIVASYDIHTLSVVLAAPQEPLPLMRAAKPSGEAKGAFSLDDEIVSEHFTRNIQFFGRASQERIMQSFVIVVGLGVGSHLLYLPTSAGSYLAAEPHPSDTAASACLPG